MDFKEQLEAFRQRHTTLSSKTPQLPIEQTEISAQSITTDEKEIVLYVSEDGNVNVSVYYNDDTFWLSQKNMGELFGVASNTITYHLQEIFKTGELSENSVTQVFRVTASDGKNYNTKFYNLDAIMHFLTSMNMIC